METMKLVIIMILFTLAIVPDCVFSKTEDYTYNYDLNLRFRMTDRGDNAVQSDWFRKGSTFQKEFEKQLILDLKNIYNGSRDARVEYTFLRLEPDISFTRNYFRAVVNMKHHSTVPMDGFEDTIKRIFEAVGKYNDPKSKYRVFVNVARIDVNHPTTIHCSEMKDKSSGYVFPPSEMNVTVRGMCPVKADPTRQIFSFCGMNGWTTPTLWSRNGKAPSGKCDDIGDVGFDLLTTAPSTTVKRPSTDGDTRGSLCYMMQTFRALNDSKNVEHRENRKGKKQLVHEFISFMEAEKAGELSKTEGECALSALDLIIELKAFFDTPIWSQRLRDSFEQIMYKYQIKEGALNFRSRHFAMMVKPKISLKKSTKKLIIAGAVSRYNGLTLELRSTTHNLNGEIILVLPKSILDDYTDRLGIVMFKDAAIFDLDAVSSRVYQVYVSGIVTEDSFKSNVSVTFRNRKDKSKPPNKNWSGARCVLWNQNLLGSWNDEGCTLRTKTMSDTYVAECSCNRLGVYGLLVPRRSDVGNKASRHPLSRQLTIFIISCAVALLFLIMTIVTHAYLHHCRWDNESKVLFCLSLTFLFTNVVYAADVTYVQTGPPSYPDFRRQENAMIVCWILALLLEYFLISSLSWIGANAYLLYISMVKVERIHKYIMIKLVAFSSGVPALVIIAKLIYGIDKQYGLDSRSTLCWLRSFNSLVSFIIVVGVICVFIIFVFGVLKKMARPEKTSSAAMITKRLKMAVTIAILFLATWTFAIFATDLDNIPLAVCFCFTNSLMTVLMFSFYGMHLKDQLNNPLTRWLSQTVRKHTVYVAPTNSNTKTGIITVSQTQTKKEEDDINGLNKVNCQLSVRALTSKHESCL